MGVKKPRASKFLIQLQNSMILVFIITRDFTSKDITMNFKLSETIYFLSSVKFIIENSFESISVKIIHCCGSTDFSRNLNLFGSNFVRVYATTQYHFDPFYDLKVIRNQLCNFVIITEDYNKILFSFGNLTRLIRRSNF